LLGLRGKAKVSIRGRKPRSRTRAVKKGIHGIMWKESPACKGSWAPEGTLKEWGRGGRGAKGGGGVEGYVCLGARQGTWHEPAEVEGNVARFRWCGKSRFKQGGMRKRPPSQPAGFRNSVAKTQGKNCRTYVLKVSLFVVVLVGKNEKSEKV